MRVYDQLLARAENHDAVRVGLVGCGQMGSGLVHVVHKVPGMKVVVIADIDVQRPLSTLYVLGYTDDDIVVTVHKRIAEDAICAGKVVVTEDPLLVTHIETVQAVVEATGLTDNGARVAWECIKNAKHIVMLNVETDVTVGPQLFKAAQAQGCVYTVASGDEPGELNRLYQQLTLLGFKVVCLGKGKNNPMNLDATPDSCMEEALVKGMNPKMLAAFKDGSKTMVEMAAVSNATGLVPDVPGMHGLAVERSELANVFVPVNDGGILTRAGCVDYTTGRVAPGIFAIVTSDDARIRKDMGFVGMGAGPYYVLLRPYHLCNIETPLSIAEAVFDHSSTGGSRRFVSEVVAVAKRTLSPGEMLGTIGSADYYGRIYDYKEATMLHGIPLGLAQGCKVQKKVTKGQVMTWDHCLPASSSFAYQLRHQRSATS